jgi:photosynthetic reaction center cytochrome c subunit
MRKGASRILQASLAVAGFLGLSATALPAQATSSTANPAGKTAEQVYKNIQVLKGVPADQLIPAMQFITASLGVQCDFCHVENAFDKDDKKTKQTARKMMQMMFAINKDNFDGHREVTCYACHRGAPKPVTIPIIAEGEMPTPHVYGMNSEEASVSSLPTADKIIQKYLQAVGGADAVSRISSRVQKGTLIVGAQHFPVEVLTQAPAMRVSIVQFPNGESVTGFDGQAGWLSAPGRPVHEMSASENEAARMDADLRFPANLTQLFTKLTVKPSQKLDGHDTYVIQAAQEGQPPALLYFDEESGLLVRLVRYVETPLGLNPSQIDYADYREANGVQVPFRWTVARPNGRFTIQIEQMQQNVPIAPEKFQKPAAGAVASSPPPTE